MRFARLRSTFQRLVASAGIVTAGGRVVAGGCCPPMAPIVVDTSIDPRDPVLAPLVADCRASDTDCVKLCAYLVYPDGIVPDTDQFLACFIRDRAPDQTDVHMEYFHYEECIAGRRPPGLIAPAAPSPAARRTASPAADWLAAAAHLEAASVPAFVLLARDLVRLGAPPALVRAALAAADDEIAHARTVAALARRAGAEPPPVDVTATAPRDLTALAHDNAVEGCVRETFAALIATHQASAATDPAVARAFATIAVDETRHAALAFAVDDWVGPLLAPRARAQVAAARAAAVDQLRQLAAAPSMSPAAAAAIGWPTPAVAARLVDGARRTVWA